jgi:hypothetical protein
MTGGSRASEREERARAGRLGRPRWWAEWAARMRDRPGREGEQEQGSPRWKFLFFLFQKCEMIFSFIIYVIIYL